MSSEFISNKTHQSNCEQLCVGNRGFGVFLILDNTSLGTITQLNQPLYSPYLTLRAFWPFPQIKYALKGPRLAAMETIRKTMPKAAKAISKKKWELEKAFQKCFQRLGCLLEISVQTPKRLQGRTVLTQGCLLKIRYHLLRSYALRARAHTPLEQR